MKLQIDYIKSFFYNETKDEILSDNVIENKKCFRILKELKNLKNIKNVEENLPSDYLKFYKLSELNIEVCKYRPKLNLSKCILQSSIMNFLQENNTLLKDYSHPTEIQKKYQIIIQINIYLNV